MKVLVLVVLFSVSLNSHADSASPLCNDLAKFSCAPGVHDDGTGVAENNMYSENDKSEKIREEAKRLLTAKYQNLMNDPSSAYFRSLTLSGLGLDSDPACVSKSSSAKEACNKNIVLGLVKFSTGTLFQHSAANETKALPPQVYNLEARALIMGNINFRKVTDEVSAIITKQVEDPKAEKEIETKLVDLKKLIAARIQRMNIDEKMKSYMISKVTAIEFEGTDCTELKTTNLSRHFIANAYYRPTANSIKVCKAFLTENISDFRLAGILVHELAHSIDPCGLTNGPTDSALKHADEHNLAKMDSDYPVNGLINCLRSSNSVEAKNKLWEDLKSQMTQAHTQNQAQATISPPTPPIAGVPPHSGSGYGMGAPFGPGGVGPKFSHCDDDQISESMSDWFSAEVVTDYIQEKHPGLTAEQWQTGFSNIFRPSCSNAEDRSEFDEHPDTYMRINAMYLTNPKIREKMKCPANHPKLKYCDAAKLTEVPPEKSMYYNQGGAAPGSTPPIVPPVSPSGGTSR